MGRSGGSSRRRAVRRRRAVAAVVVVLLAAGVAVTLATSGGGGTPHYRPGGQAEIATVLTPTSPTAPAALRVPAFKPAPAARRLASTLSLPAQVAQLFLVSVEGTGQSAVSGLGATPWGGVVLTRSNFTGATQAGGLTSALTAAARTAGSVPPLLAATQDGGPGTALPGVPPEGEAQIGSGGQPALARTQALAAAKALRGLGIAMTIAPLADVDTPDGALSGRLFSTSPSAVARFSSAAVTGYAGGGLIAAAAHFPGEGGASADPDEMSATVGGSLAALEDRDLLPFAAIATHVPVIVMSNAEYTAFDGVTPADLLPAAVKLLRDTYGFTGVVMSDDLDATLLPTGDSPGQVAVQALQAGDDLLYITGPASERLQAYDAVLALARRSGTARALVRQALLRDLTLKARYGVLSGSISTGTTTGAAVGASGTTGTGTTAGTSTTG